MGGQEPRFIPKIHTVVNSPSRGEGWDEKQPGW